MVAGEAEELEATGFTGREVSWISGPPAAETFRARVKIRYRHPEAAATLRCRPGRRVEVVFDTPQRAITPGQAAVFYEGDVCLGGAWIAERE